MNSLGIWIFVLFAAGQLDGIYANKTNAETVLNYINLKRSLYEYPPLILSDDLSLNCTKHAEEIALLGIVTHSKPNDNSYTDNICTFNNNADSLRLCVEKWYDGGHYGMMEAQAEEFTAMIWRSSKFMGYGEAMLDFPEAVMVVRFVPGGNVLGQYNSNVPPVLRRVELDWRSEKEKDKKKKKKKKKKNCAIHQANQGPLCMLTILTISYCLGFILN